MRTPATQADLSTVRTGEHGGPDEVASGDYVSTHETHVGAVALVGIAPTS